MTYWIYDIVIGVVLLLFALRGRKRGLVLSLCSLAAIVVAFVCAGVAADTLTPRVADLLTPKISAVLERRLEDVLQTDGTSESVSCDGAADEETSAADGGGTATDGDQLNEDGASGQTEASDETESETGLDQLLASLSSLKLPAGMLDSIKNSLGDLDGISDIPSALSNAVVNAAAQTVLYLLIFLISFVIVLLLWRIVSHVLDLVAHLPVLHFFNQIGGFAFGLCKGALLLFLVAWVLRFLGNIIPDDAVEHTYLLHFFMTTNPLTLITGI